MVTSAAATVTGTNTEVGGLRKELGFYKFYHHNTVNVLIHSVCDPTILFTTICILHRVSLPFQIMGVYLTLGHLLALRFAATYCRLHIPVGICATAILVCTLYALDAGLVGLTLKQESGIFVAAWIMQFIGHGVFEKKKPALLDSLEQSLVLAPYFILFEFLFLLGFFPKLRAELESDVTKLKLQEKRQS